MRPPAPSPSPGERVVDLALEAEWAQFAAWWTRRFGREPSIESALFMVGLQERGQAPREVPRDGKQDVIMAGTYRVLGEVGLYRRSEADGTWERTGPSPVLSTSDQESLLRAGLIRYFRPVLAETD